MSPLEDFGPTLPQVSVREPEVLREKSRGGVVLLCDHASNFIPPELGDLGLSDDDLERHIAWDMGAAQVTRMMSEMMDVPAVLGSVSRLVIDSNRDVADASLIPVISDGSRIRGNEGLTGDDTQARVKNYYNPFHKAADHIVRSHLAEERIPLVVGIHSFTPLYAGQTRPWHIGLLYDRDPRLAQAIIGMGERETELRIGDNEPYSGKQLYFSMERHGARHGLPQTTIEIRQDLLENDAHCEEWAVLFANFLDECLNREDIMEMKHY